MISRDDILCSDKFLALEKESDRIVYNKTDVFIHPRIQWRGRIHSLRDAPVWISGHSDYGITPAIYERFRSRHTGPWFTINKETDAPNLFALPLGITNDCDDSPIHRIYGNTDIMVDVMNQPRAIVNTVYMNFSIATYRAERQAVWDRFKAEPWVTCEPAVSTLEGRRRFLQSIRNHRFVLCPRGNGVDTHRLWETLYMGSIPIVKRHLAFAEFADDLPICWIDDWAEVTPAFLESEFKRISEKHWNLEKLTFGYWRKRIMDNIT